MYKIENIKLHSTRFPFNTWDDTLELIFEIDEQDIWSRNFTIRINKNGEIVGCSSLMSSMDNIDYYIQMGETLSLMKNFITKYGKEMYEKLKKNEEKNEKICEEIIKVIEYTENKIKEEDGYYYLIEEEKDLFNESCNLRKKRRRLRREDKIAEITKEIDYVDKKLELVREKIEDIKGKIKVYNEESNKVLEEMHKKNYNLITEMFNNYMSKLEELA